MFNIDEIVIEITRKCNMNCSHCLRGNKQNLGINFEYIDKFLDIFKGKRINTFNITGGEPSLFVEGIKHILKVLKHKEISVDSFYIATNGSKSSYHPDFINVLMSLYLYQSERDNDVCMVELSNDDYHNKKHYYDALETLSMFSFFKVRRPIGNIIVAEGKAKHFGGKYLKPNFNIDFHSWGDFEIETMLYLNCRGYIFTTCDFSYETQNRIKRKSWHVSNFKETLLKVYYDAKQNRNSN